LRVPPVEGLPRGQAQGRLNDAGLASETRTREAPGAEAGRVISQSPCGGKSVARGSAVTLTVARSSTVTIPEVVSLSLADAEAELRRAGLTVGRRCDLRSESAAEGVVEQGIPAGQEVSSGSAVNVGVGSGAAAPVSASPASSASPPSSQETLVSPAPGDGAPRAPPPLTGPSPKDRDPGPPG
jgi:beta-lactam-binding protein with PASTA domain